ncbi:MAG: ATP-binding protein [Bacteroidales bacterium]
MAGPKKTLSEKFLPQTAEFFEATWENSIDGMRLTNEDGIVVKVNEAYCKIVGKKKKSLEGKPLSVIYLKEAREEVQKKLKENFQKKENIPYYEALFRLWDGREVWLGVSVSYINYTDDKYLVLNVFRDISDRKKQEDNISENQRQLKEQNEKLTALIDELKDSNIRIKEINNELNEARRKAEENDRLKTTFLANMSHEIRTPMNGILGFADLLKKPGIPADKHDLYLQVIEQSGHRMLGIINDIIDISKIESGLIEISLQQTNLNELLHDLHSFFSPEAENLGTSLQLHTPLNYYDSIIETDPHRLEQIFTNLIKNALKFSAGGQIDFGYRKTDTYLDFFVRDNGTGIDEDNKKYIFERFWRMENSKSKNLEGAGLGLAITKSLIEIMGGEIWFESAPGRGTEFFFNLPKTTVEDNGSGDQKSANSDLSTEYFKSLKILIAEDDYFSVEFLKAILSPLASELIIAGTGVEAVKFCKDISGIDLIMMDIKMPAMDGLEATRKIREFNKDIPIIAQTAFALQGDREKAIEAGCNDYLTKPVKAEELRAKILKAISKSKPS